VRILLVERSSSAEAHVGAVVTHFGITHPATLGHFQPVATTVTGQADGVSVAHAAQNGGESVGLFAHFEQTIAGVGFHEDAVAGGGAGVGGAGCGGGAVGAAEALGGIGFTTATQGSPGAAPGSAAGASATGASTAGTASVVVLTASPRAPTTPLLRLKGQVRRAVLVPSLVRSKTTSTLSASMTLEEITLARSVFQPSLAALSRQAVLAVEIISSLDIAMALPAIVARLRAAAEEITKRPRVVRVVGILRSSVRGRKRGKGMK
jgi:hypothetical protein